MSSQDKISDYNDRIRVLRTKLSVEDNSQARYQIQNDIKVLEYRKEIENIKSLIARIEGK